MKKDVVSGPLDVARAEGAASASAQDRRRRQLEVAVGGRIARAARHGRQGDVG